MNEGEKKLTWFEENKRHIGWAIVVLAIVGASFFGYEMAMPDPPSLDSLTLRVRNLEEGAAMSSFAATGSGEGYTNLTSLNLEDDLYVGDDATIVGDLDAATLSVPSLTIDGVTYVSSTAAITITGVLTNVNLIYFQN